MSLIWFSSGPRGHDGSIFLAIVTSSRGHYCQNSYIIQRKKEKIAHGHACTRIEKRLLIIHNRNARLIRDYGHLPHPTKKHATSTLQNEVINYVNIIFSLVLSV